MRGNSLNPLTPPPPPPPPPKSNLPMLYYGLVVVASAAIVLAIYNLIVVRWCTTHYRRSRQTTTAAPPSTTTNSNINITLVPSFKYKKGKQQLEDYDNECSVCLCVFEEGEEVRELPRCKHSFHSQCIDMWLYSHLDCPLCRAPAVEPTLGDHRRSESVQIEHSREGLLDQVIAV